MPRRHRRPVQPRAPHPGKEEFARTLRYSARGSRSSASPPRWARRAGGRSGPDRPRDRGDRHRAAHSRDPGIDHPKVASYVDIVEGRKTAGSTVAIVGAGGIGFDVAELLTAGQGARRSRERRRRERSPSRRVPRGMGHRHARTARAAAHAAARARGRRAQRCGCCSGRRRRSAPVSPRPPAGFAATPLAARRGDGVQAWSTCASTTTGCTTVDGKPAGARRRHRRGLRGTGGRARRIVEGCRQRASPTLIGGADTWRWSSTRVARSRRARRLL